MNSFPDMIFIFLLALIIFGPKKLPEIGRQIGRMMNEFKRASNEFKAQIEAEINQLDFEKPHRQTILPPIEPPSGALATRYPSKPETIIAVDSAAQTKAPDA